MIGLIHEQKDEVCDATMLIVVIQLTNTHISFKP